MLDVVERLCMIGGGNERPSDLELEAAAEIRSLRSKLQAKEKREADLTRAWESKLYEYSSQVDTLASRLEAQSKLLDDLARRHEGWEQGCGPCVCEHHEAWRKSRVVEIGVSNSSTIHGPQKE